MDMEPLSPNEAPTCYVLNTIDHLTGETSVLKLKTDTLSCTEIYKSKFKIINISQYEIQVDPVRALLKSNTAGSTVIDSKMLFARKPSLKEHNKGRRLSTPYEGGAELLVDDTSPVPNSMAAMMRRKSKADLLQKRRGGS